MGESILAKRSRFGELQGVRLSAESDCRGPIAEGCRHPWLSEKSFDSSGSGHKGRRENPGKGSEMAPGSKLAAGGFLP